MVELVFDYEQSKTIIQDKLTDYFGNIIKAYYQKAQIEPNTVVFFSHSIQIPENKKVIDVMTQVEQRDKKMNISVFPLYISKNDKVIVDSKEIIFPSPALFNMYLIS